MTAPPLPLDELLKIVRVGVADAVGRTVIGIESLRYSERQSSAIACCKVFFANGEPMQVWAKTLRPGGSDSLKENRTARDFDLHVHLDQAFDPAGPFRVPRPLFHSPEHRLIVTEHMAGTRLQDHIQSLGRVWALPTATEALMRSCYAAGQWLKAFQAATKGYFPGRGIHLRAPKKKDAHRIIEQALERLTELAATSAVNPGLIQALRHFLDGSGQILQPVTDDTCAIHGDFFPGNLLADGDTLVGIDFTSSTWGTPAFDPAYFVFQLETLANSLTFTDKTITQLRRAFLEGYGQASIATTDYWSSSPVTRVLFVTLSISRLLALRPRKTTPRLKQVLNRHHAKILQRKLHDQLQASPICHTVIDC